MKNKSHEKANRQRLIDQHRRKQKDLHVERIISLCGVLTFGTIIAVSTLMAIGYIF